MPLLLLPIGRIIIKEIVSHVVILLITKFFMCKRVLFFLSDVRGADAINDSKLRMSASGLKESNTASTRGNARELDV